MANGQMAAGIVAGRLPRDELAANFNDLHPAYAPHEAAVAADRCYFCYDAPCIEACPTDIDIPMFMRQIQAGNATGAALTIFEQNILGGMCARVCPTETLCEEVCVRETAEGNPVEIGRLQRYATDTIMAAGSHPFTRAAPTGKRVAIVGAGPAGLACAHRLAMLGHDVVIFEARSKPGGLNEFGIAAYKATDGFAASEVDWLLKIGGIEIRTGRALGNGLTLAGLQGDHDAVFLGMGMTGVNGLQVPGADLAGVEDAVDFIAQLRQAGDLAGDLAGGLADLPVGRNVVVIGGGMTAVDAAVQSRLLGAQNVTIAYRRGRAAMAASRFEQDLAATKGVRLMFNVQPVAMHGAASVQEIELEYTVSEGDRLKATGEFVRLAADQVFLAIGQKLQGAPGALALEHGKIAVTGAGRTSLDGVWAGGDCASGGDDLTVTAVAEGRDAAIDINDSLRG